MPAGYAHYRFGRLLLPELPPEVRQCVQRFRRMYDMGLQGPDLFFYTNPFLKTETGELGKLTHRRTGEDFFRSACLAADSEAARAYLYGLLAHYCLDAACHPFIDQADAAGLAPHVPLESEFDRYLMALDGIPEPHRHDLSPHIRLTRGECVTVARFYPPASGNAIRGSIRFMAFAFRFLSGPNREKRDALLKKIKPSLCEFFVPEAPVTAWVRMDSELLARFNRCLTLYPRLLSRLEAHRLTGEDLGADFAATFSG